MDNREQQVAEEIMELQGTHFWKTLNYLKDRLVGELQKKMFMPVRQENPIFAEPQLGQIVASRASVIEGVNRYFELLDKYVEVLRKEREIEKKSNPEREATNG